MTPTYLGVTFDTWMLIFELISAVTLVVGVGFAAIQLRSMARQSRLTALRSFQEILAENADLFDTIVHSFPVDATPSVLEKLSERQLGLARRAVDAQNLIGQMIEAGVVEPTLYFNLTHVQLVRLGFVLKPFTDWVGERQGSTYGARIHRIAERALRYHRLNPVYRDAKIIITRPEGEIVVYTPTREASRISAWSSTFRFRLRSAIGRF